MAISLGIYPIFRQTQMDDFMMHHFPGKVNPSPINQSPGNCLHSDVRRKSGRSFSSSRFAVSAEKKLLGSRGIPSGKQPHNYGKSPILMGKLWKITILNGKTTVRKITTNFNG